MTEEGFYKRRPACLQWKKTIRSFMGVDNQIYRREDHQGYRREVHQNFKKKRSTGLLWEKTTKPLIWEDHQVLRKLFFLERRPPVLPWEKTTTSSMREYPQGFYEVLYVGRPTDLLWEKNAKFSMIKYHMLFHEIRPVGSLLTKSNRAAGSVDYQIFRERWPPILLWEKRGNSSMREER